jgi:dihydropteridine reductase
MLGYGLSKVGAHHFVHTLGETTGKSIATKSRRRQARRLRKDSEYLDTLSAVGILPTTIDTPSNRDAMPKADFNQWTKPIDIAKEIGTWIKTPPLRPHSGSLVKVHPASRGDGATFTLVR